MDVFYMYPQYLCNKMMAILNFLSVSNSNPLQIKKNPYINCICKLKILCKPIGIEDYLIFTAVLTLLKLVNRQV